jgi:hypothetical protein
MEILFVFDVTVRAAEVLYYAGTVFLFQDVIFILNLF